MIAIKRSPLLFIHCIYIKGRGLSFVIWLLGVWRYLETDKKLKTVPAPLLFCTKSVKGTAELIYKKMKKLNYLWMLGLLMFAAINFASCSDDDDAPGASSDLIGLWELVSEEGWNKYNDGETNEWKEFEDDHRIKFNADGTAMSYEYYNGKWNEQYPATWQYKGGKLYLTSYVVEYEEEIVEVGIVKELSSSRLVIEIHEIDDDGEHWERITYRKIE